MTTSMDRRQALQAAGLAAGGGLLAACSGGTAGPRASGPAPAPPSAVSSQAGAAPLAQLADLPVGGAIGVAATQGPVLLVRTAQDTVVGYSAVCPHQGCTVAPAGAQLQCPCHGSAFDPATGSVISGPAPRGLTPFGVQVVAGTVVPRP